jgi:hypothetical protein
MEKNTEQEVHILMDWQKDDNLWHSSNQPNTCVDGLLTLHTHTHTCIKVHSHLVLGTLVLNTLTPC